MDEIILYWSNEAQVFIAEVPELSGCTAHFDTQQSAPAHASEDVQSLIDTAKESGRTTPGPKVEPLMRA